MKPKRYPIKKGLKIATRKRGTVSNYLTIDDLGTQALLNDLLDKGFISEPSNPEKEKKSFQKESSKGK